MSDWKIKVQTECPDEAAKFRECVTQADEAFIIYQLKEFLPRWSKEFELASVSEGQGIPQSQDNATVNSDLTTGSSKAKKKAIKGRKHEIRSAEYTEIYQGIGKSGPESDAGKSWDHAFSMKIKECIEQESDSRNLCTFYEFVGNERDERKTNKKAPKAKKLLAPPVPYTLSDRTLTAAV